MADGKTQRRNSQQNLLNYISHNLGKKSGEKSEVKSSSIKGKTDKFSANSGQRPIRPKTNTQSAASTHSSSNKLSAHKPFPRSQTAQTQQSASNKELTPTGNTSVKSHSPPAWKSPENRRKG